MKSITILFFVFYSAISHAEFAGGKTPDLMYGSGNISFGIDNPPSDLCDYWGRNLTFDATTLEGKNMLSILLAAIMSKKKIDVWYVPSTAPGTTQENGCNGTTIGTLTQIGIR